jgi:hypothetical protein
MIDERGRCASRRSSRVAIEMGVGFSVIAIAVRLADSTDIVSEIQVVVYKEDKVSSVVQM